ncbi:sulfotransferase family 2 domain-containing protein [Isoptericola sp. NPDC019482]|uniref:sulfotransferase family 2 domain-containing protein n=1 Tax=Isoptericola sp. NPDC019482 TaxID=3154688 RepID=UPI00349390DB
MPVLRKDKRGVLFVHVPKTGGSSIENHFVDAGWSMSYHSSATSVGSLNHFRWCTSQHMHGDPLRATFRLHRFEAVFMIVRDPIARFRSEYAWRHGIDGDVVDLSAGAVEAWAERRFAKYASYPYLLGNHIRPQADFLVEGADVMRFEDGLDAAVARLNDRYGLDLPPHVGRERTSEGAAGVSSKDVEISPALHDRLVEFYARDFEEFGYSTEPGSAPLPSATVDTDPRPVRRAMERAIVADQTSDLRAGELLGEVFRRSTDRARAVFRR